MASCWTHICAKSNAMHSSKSIWAHLCDSFIKMQESDGAHTGGFIGVPVFTTGDLEYFADHHQLPRWNARNPCSLCTVSQNRVVAWEDIRGCQDDTWVLPRQHQCPLFRRLLSPKAICPDYMHSKHLGTDQRFLGSVAWLFLFHLADRSQSLDDRLFSLVHAMKDTLSYIVSVLVPFSEIPFREINF